MRVKSTGFGYKLHQNYSISPLKCFKTLFFVLFLLLFIFPIFPIIIKSVEIQIFILCNLFTIKTFYFFLSICYYFNSEIHNIDIELNTRSIYSPVIKALVHTMSKGYHCVTVQITGMVCFCFCWDRSFLTNCARHLLES